jgi:MoaA/NifB/PqqE/SkfB family radical SAM enzyme
MTKVSASEYNEYKYHNWKLCQLSLDFPVSFLSHSPLEIQAEVTTHCNLQCVMCLRPFFITSPKHLHPDVTSKLSPLFPSAIRLIPFGGGEPLVFPQFTDIVKEAKHCQMQVTFNTNGLLLNEKVGQTFVSIGVDMITFSIDGVKEDTYEAIRKGSNYSKVMNNLDSLVRLKKEYGSHLMIAIAFVPMVDNFREIPELFYLASKLGINQLFFETMNFPGQNWNDEYKDFYHHHSLSNLPQTELSTLAKEYDRTIFHLFWEYKKALVFKINLRLF